ncbi:Tn3 family transposase [Phyllobacterium sp. P30BS-XVII]|uniref:Tn3 family transposase n=1 Tax=Phyllobacterium sp. P30BS-XVII TaxID=2587046 RepID=UPI0015F9A66E|nr:Tn3 family transposase [Phyllobacterium sp. P30BS-XVII]MBA8903109.1 TnpA family transposase [Phyllobacterium sp. P30BS-XVII]
MTAIDRTAYPRPAARPTFDELTSRYALSETERDFIGISARNDAGRLTLATMLKVRGDIGYFPILSDVHAYIVEYLASQLAFQKPVALLDEARRKTTLYHYRIAVRDHINATAYGDIGEALVKDTVLFAAKTMSDPADLINRAIEALKEAKIDLPAFSTLDRLVNHLRAEVHEQIYDQVAQNLTVVDMAALDNLLVVPPDMITTPFNRLKQAPRPTTFAAIKLWADRLRWLDSLISRDTILKDIAHTKQRQFASEAATLEVSDLLDIVQLGKRHTLLLCLIRQTRARCRDELIEMFIRRVRRTRAAAKEKLEELHDQHRPMEEALIAILGSIVETATEYDTDAEFGSNIRRLLEDRGGVEALAEQCQTVTAYHNGNDLPLLWPIHANTRSALFQLLDLMDIGSATQDQSLLQALMVIKEHRAARRDKLTGPIDLSFASKRWQNFIVKNRSGKRTYDRRALEVCVFIYLADALQAGDLYVVGAESYDDYRTQLLPWSECQKRLPAYCENLSIPQSGEAFAAMMKEQLTKLAAEVDAAFPTNSQLSIDAKGTPHLKKLPAAKQLAGQKAFVDEIRKRMPERHLLDILKYTEHWSRYTRHFGPPSGADTKMAHAVRRYLFTVFGYGCNLGPSQAAKHASDIASAQALRRINAQHIDAGKLEAAMSDVIGEYARFALPKVWGAGDAAIADGTHVPLRENNLLGSTHIRYGGYGGIAYHHIANNYIALFTSFISCGVWEAVHILDGLLKNNSDIQPDTLHADTQGQSEPVFGLARLLGIMLMPRIRNWHDVAFCRPDKSIRYRHIDTLFTADIDWKLIITHWQDMMQVVLSIQAGLVLPSMLLRKLGSYNRKNRLCRAFSELGRVERTLFLLRYISDPETRHTIRAETTKIESYNDFLDWITFGGPVIKSGDPVEQEKQLKYASLIANTIMLSNVTDLTEVMADMAVDGHPVTPELAASISPYSREHIRRFGKLTLDMDEVPPPLNPKPLPFELSV